MIAAIIIFMEVTVEQLNFVETVEVPTRYQVADMDACERPVNRLREAGPNAISTRELIACLLQSSEALSQADELLERIGGLEGLAQADPYMLDALEIKGVGAGQAARLAAAMELGRRVQLEPWQEKPQIKSPGDAGRILLNYIGNADRECFAVLFLDTRNRVIGKEILYHGTVNQSVVRTSEVFRAAVIRNAVGIIVAHNHPSGDPSPSPEDIALTRKLVLVGKAMELDVIDHIIVGVNRYISLNERQLGFEEL